MRLVLSSGDLGVGGCLGMVIVCMLVVCVECRLEIEFLRVMQCCGVMLSLCVVVRQIVGLGFLCFLLMVEQMILKQLLRLSVLSMVLMRCCGDDEVSFSWYLVLMKILSVRLILGSVLLCVMIRCFILLRIEVWMFVVLCFVYGLCCYQCLIIVLMCIFIVFL